MKRRKFLVVMSLVLAAVVLSWGIGRRAAQAVVLVTDNNVLSPGYGYYIPDYFNTPNWANSPPLAKFVDPLPGLYISGVSSPPDPGTQYIPVAVPDTTTYLGSDYYEIELGQYTQQMHSGLPNPTTLRGYRQTNTIDPVVSQFHYLGPVIIAKKGVPVRIKFTNNLPANDNLFLPVDTTIMGSGDFAIDYDPATKASIPLVSGKFSQGRATLHLHGGLNPWISDGTAHQWTAPAGITDYPKGVSVAYVPDMWFDASGTPIDNVSYPGSNCAGQTTCAVPGATNNPGPGKLTFFWTNDQSARFMFYHDHAYGITRLNVYAGEAAGYLINDAALEDTLHGLGVPGTIGTAPETTDLAHLIPLVIQDKTFVDNNTIMTTDPTWAWGTNPGKPATTAPVAGDLWWPHVYMPAQNPYNPDLSGINAFGRWHYGPFFFPPTPTCGSSPDAVKPFCIDHGPVANVYYDNTCDPAVSGFCQPPFMPATPNPSWGAEAFLDTMVVNGTAYPTLTVAPTKYRLRILNAAHDRFLNLQLYRAVSKVGYTNPTLAPYDFTGSGPTDLTEVAMVPAAAAAGFPATWPIDGREGGVPDPATRGPAFIQIGSEGGVLPAPVLLPNQPVQWNLDPTMFNVGNVLQQADGGGTLFVGPAERADVVVDFSNYAGQTLILYNDAPTAFPALDPHYDYYTGAPDRTDMGGYGPVLPGVGPNVRTVMQIVVGSGASSTAPPDDYDATFLASLQGAFATNPGTGVPGIFAQTQHPIVVGQSAYNSAYNNTFPATWPYWGLSLILDDAISFKQVDNTFVSNFPMERKAIHDEMGATFDDYGRMSAKLGLEIPFANAATQNFVLQNFVDPPTELVGPGEIQIWRVTHNGVDTHPIHFHLFDVQLLNRVGWDGFIRLPDPNELGWKDTVRISPLEDTIVALRPVQPPVPFRLPNSVRPLNPTMPLGDTTGFSQIDITDGADLVPPMTNQLLNFGWEYTWHCHILSHEENDMMRAVALAVPPEAPSNLVAALKGSSVLLTWTDSSLNETSFTVQRMNGTGLWATLATLPQSPLGNTAGGAMSYTDTTYKANGIPFSYRVFASDTVGGPAPSYPTKTADSAFSNVVGPPTGATTLSISQAAAARSPVVLNWTYTGTDQTGFTIQRATNPSFTGPTTFKVAGNVTSYSDGQAKAGTLYYYRVMPTSFLGNGNWSNTVSITPHP